jgi:hypothetical protein
MDLQNVARQTEADCLRTVKTARPDPGAEPSDPGLLPRRSRGQGLRTIGNGLRN